MNIARTTLSSKLLTHHKDHFARLAVEAVLRLRGSGNLQAIQMIKKLGGKLAWSYLEEGDQGPGGGGGGGGGGGVVVLPVFPPFFPPPFLCLTCPF